MSASETEAQSPSPLSMRDLLASCEAASAVSTPPRAPEPDPGADVVEPEEQRDAA
ncbi:hypothetical protein OG204_22850 [Streptomyces sp. NBC_01387]|uniref:hypothetical protein n=1 Tax=unclassified Streptomyces TaxID=2593676 RepID=UPI0020256542|nr:MULTISPECIES: hypothetical protein [unclassified Streptomyces]MCX4548837.1 hypothetical protein [Streptomyces sp. NBC_01500]WSC20422.1 hypothetical protein OIE60_12400 [Streptomyces sp. NBC_01766]WSV54455.1 hypothetical protein OG282_12460 [Streptomyces sp. NBC_01014]